MSVLGVLAVLWVSSLGMGLAVERLAGRRLDNGLLLPLGLCASIVIVYPPYALGAGDVPSIVLLAGISVVGLLLARDGLRARLDPGWPGVAGLAVYVLFMAPVILTGHWTWVGYNFDNDTAFEFLLANHLKSYGTHLGHLPASNEREFLRSYLSGGYPLGTQAQLATLSGLLSRSVAVLFQGYVSGLAAMAAVALATLARRLMWAPIAAALAFAAVSANLTYQYALQGGIKEMGVLAAVCATLAVAAAALSKGADSESAAVPDRARRQASTRPWSRERAAVLLAVPLAAVLATYNAAGAPYIAAFAVVLAATALISRRGRPDRRWLRPVVIGGALTAILALPALATFGTFFHVAVTSQGRGAGVDTSQLGQLLRPLPLSQVAGVWLSGDYRNVIQPQTAALLTSIASGAIIVLLIPGVVLALRRRQVGLPMLLGTMGLVLLVVYPRVSAYADGKLLAIASPAVVMVAGLAAVSLPRRVRTLSVVVGGALAVAIVASDILAYHHDQIAPIQRMAAIRAAAGHFAGRGLVLWNEQEEYAKFFGSAASIDEPYEAFTPFQVELRQPVPFFGAYFDLDAQRLAFVERFANIVIRRSPSASRPPANYRLVYQNPYYLGWQRAAAPVVLRHLSEQGPHAAVAAAGCPELQSLVAGAPAGSALEVAQMPATAGFSVLAAPDRSFGWGLDVNEADTVLTTTPGHASGTLRVPAGRYAVWVGGSFPSPITVQLDGHTVGSVAGVQGPGQWLSAATLQLTGGPHVVRVLRLPGRLHVGPGAGATGTVGDVALQRQISERVVSVPVSRWRSLCGEQVDWVELVQP